MTLDNMKYLMIVGDGMADEPLASLDNRTPLEVAHTPNMDFLAAHGVVGMSRTIPKGMPPGSDVANLSLLGYSPRSYYTGRAPLEAASMGLDMGPEDIAFRCNLVSLDCREGQQIMADYSGGSISTEKAEEFIKVLNDNLAGPEYSFYPGVSYRHILLWKGVKKRFEQLKTTPPHDITGQEIEPHLPSGEHHQEIRDLMKNGYHLLDRTFSGSSPGANAIWLWGQGHASQMPSLRERFGISGATVSAVDLIKGIGRSAGMEAIEVPGATGDIDTNFQGKAFAALKALKEVDFVFLHVEAPDEAGHRGDIQEKIKAIEMLDEQVLGPIIKGLSIITNTYRLFFLPDHPTPINIRTHSDSPVPFVFYASKKDLIPASLKKSATSMVLSFNEKEAGKTGRFYEEGHKILENLLDNRGNL